MKDTAPALSVIVAARDAAEFVEATLASLRRQSFDRFEVIVIDDGSQDETPAIVHRARSSDPRIRLLPGGGCGVSAARNLGLASAQADVSLFLDADDLLEPAAIERLLETLDRTGAVAALGGVLRIGEAGESLPGNDNRTLAPAHDTLAALLRKNFVVNGGALAIRTQAARTCGGYDEALAYGEDWEFWCRLAELGDFATVPGEPILMYRQRRGGANYVRKASGFGPVPCLERLSERASLRARFGPRLGRLLRARRVDLFWSGVRSEMQFGRRSRALAVAAAGLVVYPDSVLRPRLAMRLIRSLWG